MPLDQLHEQERNESGRGEMSFFDHITELRTHILRAVACIFATGLVFFIKKDWAESIIFGPKNENFLTYRVLCSASKQFGLGESMCFKPTNFEVFTRDLGGPLMQHLFLSFWLGVICSFPLIFWEFWKFISPGLHDHERKVVRGIVGICTILFMLGVAFGYYIIAPFSINFLASYSFGEVKSTSTLDSYVTYMTMFTIPTGLIFEMPVIAYFLARVGVIGAQFMRSYRRHAILGILIVAAIITPPDVLSQTLVSIPLYVLYELSIKVVARVQKNREKALALEEARSKMPIKTEYGDDGA